MLRTVIGHLVAGLMLASVLIIACGPDTAGLGTLSVPELAALLDQDKSVVVCDANNEDTRGKYGIIPGARLLSDYRDYDAVAELPQEKNTQLVFYCASEMCSAAPTAARKAVAQGYSNVSVLPVGIKGWVEADQPIAKSQAG